MIIKPIDTHAHLDEVSEESLIKARGGLQAVVGVGMDLESNRRIQELAHIQPDFVWPAYGAHPWSLTWKNFQGILDFLEQYLPEAVALGEVGLDYRVKVDKELQRRVLAQVLGMAAALGKPVLLHSRYSHERCLKMLAEAGIKNAVFHWFSGPLDILKKVLDAGYFVSATPSLAKSPPHRQAINNAPLSRILVETDSPEDHGRGPSEPADVFITINLLAEIKGLEVEEVAELTTKNALEFFRRG